MSERWVSYGCIHGSFFLAKIWMQLFEGVMKDEKVSLKQNLGITKTPPENVKKQKKDCLEQLSCRT